MYTRLQNLKSLLQKILLLIILAFPGQSYSYVVDCKALTGSHPVLWNHPYESSQWISFFGIFIPRKTLEYTQLEMVDTREQYDNGSIVGYVTPSDSFKLIGADIYWSLMPEPVDSGPPIVITGNDARITRQTSYTLVSYGKNPATVNCLVKIGIDSVALYKVEYSRKGALDGLPADTFSVIYSDGYRLQNLASGQGALGIAGQSPSNNSVPVSVFGLKGLCRELMINESKIVDETIHDLATEETITFSDNKHAGTKTGKIYNLDNGIEIAHCCSSAIKTYTACKSILTNTGDVYVQDTNTSYIKLAAEMKYIDYAGYPLIYMVDADFKGYVRYKHDYPTQLKAVKPDSLTPYINSSCYIYTGTDSDSLVLCTYDWENNYLVPQISLLNGQGQSKFDLSKINPSNYEFSSIGELCISSKEHVIHLSFDTVSFHTIVDSSTEESPMYPNTFLSTHALFRRNKQWIKDDTLMFTLGNDNFRIVHAGNTDISLPSAPGARLPRILVRDKNIALLHCERFNCASIYLPNGRCVATYTLHNKSQYRIPNAFAHGLYFIVLNSKNNERIINKCIIK